MQSRWIILPPEQLNGGPISWSEICGYECIARLLSRKGFNTAEEVRAFLRDLCTPTELQAMADRWAVVEPLERGLSYRDIHKLTGVSLTTIGRVARFGGSLQIPAAVSNSKLIWPLGLTVYSPSWPSVNPTQSAPT